MKKNWLSDVLDPGILTKTKRIMRILFILVFGFSTLASAKSYSQATRLDVQMKNQTVRQVIDYVENNSEFVFLFKPEEVNLDKKVDLNLQNATIHEIMEQTFKGEDIACDIYERQVVIRKAEKLHGGQQETKKITGIVIDNTGEAVPGVTVMVLGTTTGTVTDMEGKFQFEILETAETLQFSFIGMKTQEISANGKTTFTIVMELDAIGVDEVVVIGYGSIKKSDLTGSVSQVKAKDLAAYPSLGTVQALQGRSAGVQIQAVNGEPGADYTVRIRGATSIRASSDPLYVVDGFPGGTAPPAEDIQSIEILKDASATAIYGSRGSNGVILITTKRGSVGKAKIELNSSYSVQNEINRLDLLNKEQFTDYLFDIDPNALDGSIIGPGTDWQEEIFSTGQIQNHQLSVSGGTDDIKYYVSAGLYDQSGVIINSGYKRYSITSNLDIKASDKFRMGLKMFAQRSIKDGILTQEASGGADNTGVVAAAFKTEPTLPIYDDDGNYARSFLGDPNDNPVAIAKERSNERIDDRIQANFFGEYEFIKDLKLRVTLGAHNGNNRQGSYIPTTLNRGAAAGGYGSISSGKYTALINENYLTYTKLLGDHNILAMAGYSYESTSSEQWFTASQSYLTDAFLWWDLDGGATQLVPSSSLVETELSSYYGRINYKLFDRYLITVTGRYDGSSRFAKNNKWAFFPSGALAWNVAEESFMTDMKKISQLKLRASYGITGNQAIQPYQSLAKLGTVFSIENSTIQNAVRPTTVANDNLTWESNAQTNVGFDLGLFDQRISLVGDFYIKKTTDLLFSSPLPEYSGYSSLLKNVGSIQNKGFEFTLTTVNTNGALKWTTDLNFSLNRNKILELPDGNDILSGSGPGHMVGFGSTNIMREGEPLGVFYGYTYDGVYQEGETILPGNFDQYAGGEKFKDIDGIKDEEGELTGEADGKINGDDRTIIGNSNPDFIFGINNTLTYKNFDVNIFFQGSQGNDIYSFTLQELETLRGISNSTTEALRRWTPSNTNTDVPVASASRGYHSSSQYIMDGSYIRLKNVAIGYNLPKSAVNSIGLGNVRVYVSAQNILTFTKYRGYDPEVNYGGGGSTTRVGFDYGSYPNAKSITLGLKVTF